MPLSVSRVAMRAARLAIPRTRNSRTFATSLRYGEDKKDEKVNVFPNDRAHPNSKDFAKTQTDRPTNPHLTNTTSTIANEMPSVGAGNAPPELLTAVDPEFTAKDSVPENTERMTGGTQPQPKSGPNADLGVGEMEGVSFKVEPHRRSGEDINTLRARLLYQCRKRGCLESDLLLSTFANENLQHLSMEQLRTFDTFLDENDWDIYYWVTQQPVPTSHETAEGGNPGHATPSAQAASTSGPEQVQAIRPISGEWAQTVGNFKPNYRPVPARWRNSEMLALLKKHVADKSAGGVAEAEPVVKGENLAQSIKETGGGGLGRMPDVKNFDV